MDAVLWNVTEKNISEAENVTESDQNAAHENSVEKSHKMVITVS